MDIWKIEDPRFVVNKRAHIIIVRHGPLGPIAGTGFVDTKDGWYIHTDFKDYPSIDDWDPTWKWTFAPL